MKLRLKLLHLLDFLKLLEDNPMPTFQVAKEGKTFQRTLSLEFLLTHFSPIVKKLSEKIQTLWVIYSKAICTFKRLHEDNGKDLNGM